MTKTSFMQMEHSPAHQEFSNKPKGLDERKGIIPFLFFFVFLGVSLLFPQERFFFTLPILSVFLIFWLFLSKKTLFPENFLYIFLFLFLIFFISIFRKPNFYSFYYLGVFYFYTIVFLFFFNERLKDEKLVLILFFIFTFHAVFSIYHIYWLVPESSKYLLKEGQNFPFLKERISTLLLKKRLRSFFPLPSEFGFIFSLLLFLLLHYLRKIKENGKNALTIFLSISGGAIILLTKSFEILLSLSFVFLFLFFTLNITKREKEALLISGVFIIGSITALLSFFRWEEFINLTPLILRLKHWKIAILEFLNYPLFGVGPGNFGPFSSQFLKPGDPESKFSHNFFLQTIAENGIIGVIGATIIVFLIIYLFSEKKKVLNENIFLYVGLIFALTYSFFDIGPYYESFGIIAIFLISQIFKLKKVNAKNLNLLEKILITIPLIFFLLLFLSYGFSKSAKFGTDPKVNENYIDLSLKFYSKNSDSLFQKYITNLKNGKIDEAEKILEKILIEDPVSIVPKKEKIKILIYQKRISEAYELLKIYSKIYPNDKFFKKTKNEIEKLKTSNRIH